MNCGIRSSARALLVVLGVAGLALASARVSQAEPTTRVFKDGDSYMLQIANHDNVCYSFEYTEFRSGRAYTMASSTIHKCDGVMSCYLECAKSMADIKISYKQIPMPLGL